MKKFNKDMLLRSSVLAGMALALTAGAVAQEAPIETEEQETAEQTTETITVTGSRIARRSLDLTQPAEVVDGAEIELRGYNNAAGAVFDIPGTAAVQPTAAITGPAGSGLGQSLPSLFGLGSQRTLTLIDGRRFVSSNSPSGGAGAAGTQVDLNNIPVSLIERVEVVKVGGAAVYGSDAVAGVINYILRDDFEGAEFSANYVGLYDETDADEYSVRALVGGNFDGGRGNIVASFEFNETSPLIQADVANIRNGLFATTPRTADRVLDNGNPVPGQVRVYPNPVAGILSFSGLLTPGSAAITGLGIGSWAVGPDGGPGGFFQNNPNGDGSLVPFDPGTPTGNVVFGSGGDGLDTNLVDPLREPLRRYNFSSFVNYQLTDTVNFSMNVFANQYTASSPVTQPYYASGLFGATSTSLFFPASYPYLSADAQNLLANNGAAGLFMQRGFTDLGEKDPFNRTTTFSYNFGLDGTLPEFMGRIFNWELNYQYGSTSIFASVDDLSEDRFFAAMDVGINPATGEIDCRFNYDPTYDAPIAGGFGAFDDIGVLGEAGFCVPYNPFSNATQENLDYMLVKSTANTEIEQEIFSGFVSGSLFDLPAGELGVATGFEHRREFASYAPDGSRRLSITRDGSGESVQGEYYTTDFYVETLIPVIGGGFTPLPFIETIDVEGSYRTIDNTRAGRSEAWAVGIDVGFIENVRLRGNVARTVRTPAVQELFLPRVQTGNFITDPCDDRFIGSGPNPAVREANCRAGSAGAGLPPIPVGFTANAVNASVQGFTGGNPNLTPELANSYNIGLIWSPRWVPGLTLGIDYINIAIDQAITSFTPTQIVNACYDSTQFPNAFCTQFTRLPNGQFPTLGAYTSGFVNAATNRFDAVEIQAAYATELNDLFFLDQVQTDLGGINVRLRAYNLQSQTSSNTGSDYNDTVGNRGNPNWRGDLNVTWNRGPLTLFSQVEYVGSGLINKFSTQPLQYIDQQGGVVYNLDDSTTYDFGGSYDIGNVTLRASVNNAFNTVPDDLNRAFRGAFTLGRTYNVGITARF
ncbi:MAG: TonB-dependent receptor [Oceanicaulis sp. HLUCCA04]|nr:MAG: TonB-dependent receptor [Oceanicaulis sp. HLUCCA04]